MSNALSVFEGLCLPTTDIAVPANEPGGYAQRIQLASKGKLVDSGTVKPGNYAIIDGDSATDIGSEVDVIPIAVLDKALDTSCNPPEVYFGRGTPKYVDVSTRANTPDSGCMYGPVFLVVERKTGKFFEIFFNNKSGRSEAAKLYEFLPIGQAQAKACNVQPRAPQPASLTSKYVESKRNKSWKWHVPVIKPSTATFAVIPTKEALIEKVTGFLDQKSTPAEEKKEQGRSR